MQDIYIEGLGNFSPGEYGQVSIDGLGQCKGEMKADSVTVGGRFKCLGNLTANRIRWEGLGSCGALNVKFMQVEGQLKCSGPLTCDDLLCEGILTTQGNAFIRKANVTGFLDCKQAKKLEADEIICEGFIRLDGQVSADTIMANGFISASEIVGDKIEINSHHHGLAHHFTRYISQAELIEATTIRLLHVTAKTVNGTNITIGPKCVIDNLDCNGTLAIHPRATVNHITGSYTQINY